MGWPLVHDAPIMHYVAWRIAEGAVPYRDLFDMNFPGVYLLHLLVVTTLAYVLSLVCAGGFAALQRRLRELPPRSHLAASAAISRG